MGDWVGVMVGVKNKTTLGLQVAECCFWVGRLELEGG